MGTKKVASKRKAGSRKKLVTQNSVLIIRDHSGLEPYIALVKKNGGSFNILEGADVEDTLMIGFIEKGLASGHGSLQRVKKILRGEA